MASPKPAVATIIEQQKEVRNSLPFDDTQDFEDATKGLIDCPQPNVINNSTGTAVWNNSLYDFLKEEPSSYTANPSLWRQSRLTTLAGLFQVVDGIYQLLSTLTCAETGAAALSLYQAHRGVRPIKAIVYTHSHGDHFGGVKGFVSQEDVDSGLVKIFAPEGFLEHAVSENVYVGTAMSRRAAYMYGSGIQPGAQTQVGSGLGQTVSTGEVTLIAPTHEITKTGQEAFVDGVRMVFLMAPDTEAPSEMLIHLPDFKALCAAEDATHTFHNVLTLRGAVVRDPHNWAHYLTETIDLFGGDKTEVIFASHHWPIWGSDRIVDFLTRQRDLYAYVHDQTLRMINQGFNGPEIAEQITLPPILEQTWSARGYYGSVNHNVKAIYQRYIGWFDGNPAHLWEHTPVDRATRYVNLIGGVPQIIAKAQDAFDSGDFRWAAEILNHAVFAEPDNQDARGLLADTYEQLGYGAENGTWRNFFLSGTTELRNKNFGTPTTSASADVLAQLTPDQLFDAFAIQINGPKAWDDKISINVVLTDKLYNYRWWLSNGALVYLKTEQLASADVTISATSRALPAIAVYGINNIAALKNAGVDITGDTAVLDRLVALLDPGDPSFNIVTP